MHPHAKKYSHKKYYLFLPIIFILAFFVLTKAQAQIPEGFDPSSISDLTGGLNAINVRDTGSIVPRRPATPPPPGKPPR